jgi:cell division protein FtsB
VTRPRIRKPALSTPPAQAALPAQDESNEAAAAGNWLRGIRFSGFTILVMGLLILAVVVLAPGLRIYLDQRHQVTDLRAQVQQEQLNVDKLQAERARWEDPSYLRAQARDRLFFVMPGETSYLIINDVAIDPVPAQPVSDTIQATKVDWVESVFKSLVAAGLSERGADEFQTLGGG